MQELIELIDTKKFSTLKSILNEMNEADIAELLNELGEDDSRIVLIFRLLSKELAADTFADLDHDLQEKLVASMTDKELAFIIDELYLDDTVDLLDDLPANLVKRVLNATDASTRKKINQLLMYPDNSAGSLMTTEFMELKKSWDVAKAIAAIRKQSEDKASIASLFVTDAQRHLNGVVALRDILTASDDTLVEDLMVTDVISVKTHDDQQDVADDFKKYDLLSMPVVDSENRLVGIITVDDIVDVIEDENTEDFEKMAAITPSDDAYLKTSVWKTWKNRIPWLLLLMVSATFTGAIISSFETQLAVHSALIAFIPMLMDTGGNSGSQASVTIIRSLSLGDIEFRDIFTVLWKEIRVSLMCGITLAACNFLKMLIIDRVGIQIALIVCLTLVATVFFAKIVGCSLPLIAEKLGCDPAVMASPFITTIVDAISLLIYFSIARTFLHF